MAQFDLYENLSNSKEEFPYLLDIQHDILNKFDSRVVIPLTTEEKVSQGINIGITINGTGYILLTTQVSAVSLNILGKKITSLENKRSDIINAIDFLVTGY